MSKANKSPAGNTAPPREKLFDLRRSATHPLHRGLMTLLASPLENNLMLSRINEVYARIASDPAPTHFFDKCLDNFHIHYAVSEADLRNIPAPGPAGSPSATIRSAASKALSWAGSWLACDPT